MGRCYEYAWARPPRTRPLESKAAYQRRVVAALRNAVTELNKLRVKAGEIPLDTAAIIKTNPNGIILKLSWIRLGDEVSLFPREVPAPSWVYGQTPIELRLAQKHIFQERYSRGLDEYEYMDDLDPTQAEIIAAYKDTHSPKSDWIGLDNAKLMSDEQKDRWAKSHFTYPLWATKPPQQRGETDPAYEARLKKRLRSVWWLTEYYLDEHYTDFDWPTPYFYAVKSLFKELDLDKDFDTAFGEATSVMRRYIIEDNARRLRLSRREKHAKLFTESDKYNNSPDAEDVPDAFWWTFASEPRIDFDPAIHKQVHPHALLPI
jgi:hypothetical protein